MYVPSQVSFSLGEKPASHVHEKVPKEFVHEE